MNKSKNGRCRSRQSLRSSISRSRGSHYDFATTDEINYGSSLHIYVDECEKLIREFNCKVAHFREKVISIGDTEDNHEHREDVNKARLKCFEAAKSAKSKLSPHLKGTNTRPEFRRLVIQLSGCMELMIAEMRKSRSLMAAFPLNKGTVPTHGDVDNRVSKSGKCNLLSPDVSSLTTDSYNGTRANGFDDVEAVAKDIRSIQSLMRELESEEKQIVTGMSSTSHHEDQELFIMGKPGKKGFVKPSRWCFCTTRCCQIE
ncbi:regulator of G-protein signaling 7-binding protein-like isoform X2 [Anneissia japonica]|uniref:regulator of G-protein signaling 7-binding protein-like isoform X2 n=1 Tax=Anneissia japonica TaxID=1529436 RepID=UPI0014255C12|nr:regulator of G-protein signaling 7-binding protein-like isoform X2 [Anneissia japonica]